MHTDPIADWLAALGTLTAAGMTAKDAQAKIAAYSPMLRGKYPPSAFTMDSLEAVAAGLKFFPSYGELCDRLTAYWRENRPKAAGPAIEGPGRCWALARLHRRPARRRRGPGAPAKPSPDLRHPGRTARHHGRVLPRRGAGRR